MGIHDTRGPRDAAPGDGKPGQRKASILICGESSDQCQGIRNMLGAQADFEIHVNIVDWPFADLLAGAADRPDVLVAALGERWQQGLQALVETPQRPPTIAIGPSNEPQILRRAMQAGVRDYVAAPFTPAELVQAVQQIAHEQVPSGAVAHGRMIAVINVKGGSGASFVAANLAHILATQRKTEIGLLDLDLQFGALPLTFDLEQRSTLLEALTSTSQLDPTALRGYIARHASGVNVLSAMSEQLVLPWEVSRESVTRLLQVMRQAFPIVVVDLPRQIDPLTSAVLEEADRVLMVMQQSLAHARDAKRMQRVLTTTLGVPRDKILLVVNRHSEKQSVRERDVEVAVNPPSMTVLPNDFATVTEALNIGVPVYDYDRESPITRGLLDLVGRLGLGTAEAAAPKRGFRQALAAALRN